MTSTLAPQTVHMHTTEQEALTAQVAMVLSLNPKDGKAISHDLDNRVIWVEKRNGIINIVCITAASERLFGWVSYDSRHKAFEVGANDL